MQSFKACGRDLRWMLALNFSELLPAGCRLYRHPGRPTTAGRIYIALLGKQPYALTCDAHDCYSISLIGWTKRAVATRGWIIRGRRSYCSWACAEA